MSVIVIDLVLIKSTEHMLFCTQLPQLPLAAHTAAHLAIMRVYPCAVWVF